ncbi:unnamed protein product [Kuraishia capsulata CBS 1993]|uniref:Uncharacterized protein n=1 Tax=Kuraishia capsulata CBS 1993 TaxID=1382522 RepID=W6MT42_9ASCO|nr:uncharacterized protein KUCA_T00005903001 [Kuraishia capsulata CBS 1993]CDK29909.1 unnamed protein product [Kuraishia capsulata CBS 1993]
MPVASFDSPTTRTRSRTLVGTDKGESSAEASDAYESSDDEAPEEENLGTSKEAVTRQENEKRRLQEEKQRIERQKRREAQQKFEKQQLEKRTRSEAKGHKYEDLPDILPDDVLAAVSETEDKSEPFSARSHVRYDDLDKETLKEVSKQMKVQKLRMARKATKSSEKKGPVTVKVLEKIRKISNSTTVLTVPKAESRVVSSKDRWLKRKSLGKR